MCAVAGGPCTGQHGSAALPHAFVLVTCQRGCMWAPWTVEDGGAAVACLPGCWQTCGTAAPALHIHRSTVRLNSLRAPGARRSRVHPRVHTCSFCGGVSEQPCLGLARRAHAPCLGQVRRCLKAGCCSGAGGTCRRPPAGSQRARRTSSPHSCKVPRWARGRGHSPCRCPHLPSQPRQSHPQPVSKPEALRRPALALPLALGRRAAGQRLRTSLYGPAALPATPGSRSGSSDTARGPLSAG